MEPTVLETERGPVEVVVEGTGPPILYFHGTLSGSELALARDRSLVDDGFQIIIPHRPGFYGTPLDGQATTADTADLAALVLDTLDVDHAALIGTSAGALPAIAFAIRHPHRTAALVLQCAQTHRWDGPQWVPSARQWIYRWVRRAPTRWLLWQLHGLTLRFCSLERGLRALTGDRFDEMEHDPVALRLAEVACRELHRFKSHRAGYYNDLATWTGEDVLATGRVTCPTLILHDPLDPVAPFRHAEYAANMIEGSRLVSLHAGGHLIWTGRDASLMHECRTAFLREHLPKGARAG